MTHPSARERILKEGLAIACTKGLCRVTFGAVARRADISKSGIVAHFSSVDGLKRSIVDRALELWSAACPREERDSAGLSELTRYLKEWFDWTKTAGLTGACPIALAMFEYTYNGGAGSVRASIVAAEALWRQSLINLIDGAIESSELPPTVDSAQMAWDLFGVYLSHHVSCHFLRTGDAQQKALRAVAKIIGCLKAES